MARHGLRPDKRLGQHFLVSPSAVGKIVGRVAGCAGVLEIGPGPGVLTGPLSEHARVTAVEVDRTVLPVLAEVAPQARIVLGDALTTDLGALLDELPEPRAVVSNMPYNITGPLLEAVAAQAGRFELAVLMMQREVGEKLLAVPGDSGRGAVSVLLQAQFAIQRVVLVPPGAFLPPPKVESLVLELRPATRLAPGELRRLRTVVRAGFAQPRKTLGNTLGAVFGRDSAHSALAAARLEPNARAHQLTEAHWRTLAERLTEGA